MSLSFHDEVNKLARTKKVISLLPKPAQFRIAKALYDYESKEIHGIDIVAPLQDNGLVCFINTKDLIGWKIYFFGEYEKGTNRILAKYVKDTDIVIEAGANIGSESLLISKQLTTGHLYCFEPNPYTFERLKINLSINELENVSAYDYALGETDSQINFHIYPKGFCNAGMSSKYMETRDTIKINVVQQTLDTFVAQNNITKVDFIKMDIQGAEMDMINGSAKTIERFKPTIFTEACEPYNDTKELFKIFNNYGYTVYLIGDNATTIMANASEVKDGNWLAIYKR